MTVNAPEFIVVDAFGIKDEGSGLVESGIIWSVQEALGFGSLNYQYGYLKELNQTMKQWEDSPQHANLKFPLIWLEQPFTIVRGNSAAYYGQIKPFRVFIIESSTQEKKAHERMKDVFKPKIYPIYRELLNQIDLSAVFMTNGIQLIKHEFTDRYFWGEEDLSQLNDIIDCSIVQFFDLKINNNFNCVTPGMVSL